MNDMKSDNSKNIINKGTSIDDDDDELFLWYGWPTKGV